MICSNWLFMTDSLIRIIKDRLCFSESVFVRSKRMADIQTKNIYFAGVNYMWYNVSVYFLEKR